MLKSKPGNRPWIPQRYHAKPRHKQLRDAQGKPKVNRGQTTVSVEVSRQTPPYATGKNRNEDGGVRDEELKPPRVPRNS